MIEEENDRTFRVFHWWLIESKIYFIDAYLNTIKLMIIIIVNEIFGVIIRIINILKG